MNIYLKGKKPRSIKEVIKRMIGSPEERTPKDNNYVISSITYLDPECNKIQCNRSYRSFDDVLSCCQTYFKTATPKKVFKNICLLNIKRNNIQYYPQFAVCGGMLRIRVIYVNNFYQNNLYLDWKGSNSQFTWRQLFNMLGVNNCEEMKEYIDKNRYKK